MNIKLAQALVMEALRKPGSGHQELAELLQRETALLEDQMELAWSIIANVSGGNWRLETTDWQNAAGLWRDRFYVIYHQNTGAARKPELTRPNHD